MTELRVKDYVIEIKMSHTNEMREPLYRLMIFPVDNLRGGLNRHRMLKQTDWFPVESLADYVCEFIFFCYAEEEDGYLTNRAWN